MRYLIEFSEQAIEDLKWLKKTEPAAFKKVQKLIDELFEHPQIGTGKPELMRYGLASQPYPAIHNGAQYESLQAEAKPMYQVPFT